MISGGGISGMTEKVCNLIVNGEEALRLSAGLKRFMLHSRRRAGWGLSLMMVGADPVGPGFNTHHSERQTPRSATS
jgi:hypothetical protein